VNIRARATKARTEGLAGMQENRADPDERRDIGRLPASASRPPRPSCAKA
jgi:hypothetical protein